MIRVLQERLADILSHGWWRLLLRGVVAILFAILIWRQPGLALATLVLVFGAYALADGFLAVWTAIAGRKYSDSWGVLLLGGLLGIGVGLLTFLAPGITALSLLFYIAVWAIGEGLLSIVAAIRLRKEIENEWLLILSGLASVVFGVLLMAQPGAGALTVLWLIAAYALVVGVLLISLAFKARSFGKRLAM